MIKRFFTLIFSYIRRHVTLIAAGVISTCVFLAVFALYSLPTEPVLYASALCLVLFVILGIIRFTAFSRRHRALMELERKLDVELLSLPRPQSIIEKDYQELLRALYKSRTELVSASDRALTEMTEYYTLWAHQIKTPIAAMRLLLDENTDEQVLTELFRIEQYVDMVLTYVRTEADFSDYVFRLCRVDSIARAAVRKYARLFIAKKLTLDYRPTELSIVTDEKWLQFVIEQILSNAVKYTDRGGVKMYVQNAELVIEDTGIGIAPEDLPRVCERGYTGYTGRADKRATGIGLYLCRRVLTSLNHTIRLESVLGEGTRVIIGFNVK